MRLTLPVQIALCLVLASGWGLARAEDWPQWLGANRDSVWHETGVVDQFPPGGPPVKWRVNIGAGYSGPVVAKGRVYVTDRFLGAETANPTDPFQRGSITG